MRIFAYEPVLSGSVRARLLRLTLILLLPGLVLAVLLTEQVFVTEREGADTALLETARGLSQVIDREFAEAEVLLGTLAAAANTGRLDLAAFDSLARQTAVMHGAVVMRDATGQELIDTGLPQGAKLPRHDHPQAEPAPEARLRISGLAPNGGVPNSLASSGVTPGSLPPGGLGLGMHIAFTGPVTYEGKPVTLELLVPAEAIRSVLVQEKLPARWIAAVLNQQGVLVARTARNTEFAGTSAHQALIEAIAGAPEAVRNSISLDNVPVVIAYHRSARTGWTVAVNAPRLLTVAAGLHSIRLLLLAGGFALLLGVIGASLVARGIARRIEALAYSARALGDTENWVPVPRGLEEADAVDEALRGASLTLVQRREQLSELNATLAARVRDRTSELAEANLALAEQRRQLGVLLDHLPIGVVVNEAARGMIFANAEARRLLRLPAQGSLEACAWPPIRRGVTPLQDAEQPWVQAAEGIVTERILLNLDAGARQIDIEVSALPLLREEAGHVLRVVTILQDVTIRLEAEEARRRAQRLEAVGQLTGGIAHEFNNLLMAVSGCLELLSPQVTEGRGPRLLANAQRATERGSRLTRQLLAFARRQHLQPEPVDLNLLVTNMEDLLEGTLGRSIEIVTALGADVWPAMVDLPQIELTLLNLSINARDAMPAGGRLTLATANVQRAAPRRAEEPPAGDFAVLRVTDTGTGMSPQVLARVFEPFFTTKEIGFGSGLGLAQVLGVAQQLGGGVTIDSAPGQGTTVSIFLPRAAVLPGRADGPEPADAPHAWLTGLRLMVVDDDADVREIARDMLTEMGAAVAVADSAAAALLHLRTIGAVDLVLADLTMPVMNGLGLAHELESVLPGLPVVLMTGYGASATESAGPNIRATLQKPFRANALGKLLVGVLGRAASTVRA